jgi:diacylglycerol kinase family enzyme
MPSDSPPLKAEQMPLFINPASGTARAVLNRIEGREDLKLVIHEPQQLKSAIHGAVAKGVPRIAVCGGDGTLGLAVNAIADSGMELAVIPGGTLNHFAARHGIPTDTDKALALARTGIAERVAVGCVNGHLFINTSSVGAYVTFVRSREFLERRMGYTTASFFAGVRRLVRLRSSHIRLENNLIKSPLVFIGVGERNLNFPLLGDVVPGGRDGLHLIAIKSDNGWQTLKLAVNAILRGVDPLAREQQLQSDIRSSVELSFKRPRTISVATDGELVRLRSPLNYRLVSEGIQLVKPS